MGVLLLTVYVPHFGPEVDAAFVADELVRVLNEQREPGTEAIEVDLFPAPQWLPVAEQRMLLRALQLVHLALEPLDGSAEATDG
jgi:hypothetical protein